MNVKTMCAAALAGIALTLSADTEDEKAAQVYDIRVTIKTTAAKNGSLSKRKNPFVEENGKVVYRAQASQTWAGVLWGCGCETLLGEWKTVGEASDIVAGVAIWNSKSPYSIMFLDDMRWRVLDVFDTAATKCEAAWTIGDSSDDSAAFLAFAGFGTATLSTERDDDRDLVLESCGSVVKSVSGSVAGWMPAPTKTILGDPGECTFCHGVTGATEDSEEVAVAWNPCPCEEIGDLAFTAVSGTWSIKYNKTASKKLSSTDSILKVYTKFPANVRTAIAAKIADVAAVQ